MDQTVDYTSSYTANLAYEDIPKVEIEDKFRSLAESLLTENRAGEIINRVWELEEGPDPDSFLGLLPV